MLSRSRAIHHALATLRVLAPRPIARSTPLSRLQPSHSFHVSTSNRQPDLSHPEPSVAHTISDPNFIETLSLSFLDNLHQLAPWSVAIPLAAITTRLLITPLDWRNRLAQQRFLDLQPLIRAWNQRITQLTSLKHSPLTKTPNPPPGAPIAREILLRRRAKKRELLRRWRAGWVDRTSAVLWQLPVFMTMMGVLRRATIPERGDFLLARPLTWAFDRVQAAVDAISAPTDAFNRIFGGGSGGSGDFTLRGLDTEGCLWFTDLTLADPTGHLPILLIAVNAANIFRHVFKPGKLTNFQKIVNSVAVLLLGVMLQASWMLPSGLVWYWTWSSTTTLAVHLVIDRLKPLKKSPMPCKKPARIVQTYIRPDYTSK